MSDAIKAIAFIVERAGRTSSQFANVVKEWRNAPKEVQFLIEDIQLSRHIARQLQRLWVHSASHNLHGLDVVHALYAQYRRSGLVWSKLDEIAHSIVGATGRRFRNERWLRQAKRVAELQEKLYRIRMSTAELLTTHVLFVNTCFLLPLTNKP